MIGISPDFDSRKDLGWIRKVLTDPFSDETGKMDNILYHIKYKMPQREPQTETAETAAGDAVQ